MSMESALAQLRHLYAQMTAGIVLDPRRAAQGLLAPAIKELELVAKYHQTGILCACHDCILSALRAAEDEALERAAKMVWDRQGEIRGNATLYENHALQHAAHAIRRLKSQSKPSESGAP